MGSALGATIVEWASDQAEMMLSPVGDRWRHVQAVVWLATAVSKTFTESERDILVSAAYLHDLGYAPALQQTGFHQLDGATYLRSLGHERLARLVAHHSEARFEAELRGYGWALEAYPRERSAVADALTYCDQLTGPTGERVTFKERYTDVRVRYGEKHVVSQALKCARPYLVLGLARTQRRLRAYGLLDQLGQLK
jgi:HD superfamily phosphodiesterase